MLPKQKQEREERSSVLLPDEKRNTLGALFCCCAKSKTPLLQ
jgi:hypothetical protein